MALEQGKIYKSITANSIYRHEHSNFLYMFLTKPITKDGKASVKIGMTVKQTLSERMRGYCYNEFDLSVTPSNILFIHTDNIVAREKLLKKLLNQHPSIFLYRGTEFFNGNYETLKTLFMSISILDSDSINNFVSQDLISPLQSYITSPHFLDKLSQINIINISQENDEQNNKQKIKQSTNQTSKSGVNQTNKKELTGLQLKLIKDIITDAVSEYLTIDEAVQRIKKTVLYTIEQELNSIMEEFDHSKNIKETISKLGSLLQSQIDIEKIGNPFKDIYTKALKKILVYSARHRRQLTTYYNFWHRHFLTNVIGIRDANWLWSFIQSYAYKGQFFRFDSEYINRIHPDTSRDNKYLMKKLIKHYPLLEDDLPRSPQVSESDSDSSSASDSESDSSDDDTEEVVVVSTPPKSKKTVKSSTVKPTTAKSFTLDVDLDNDDIESLFEEPIEDAVLIAPDSPPSPTFNATTVSDIFKSEPASKDSNSFSWFGSKKSMKENEVLDKAKESFPFEKTIFSRVQKRHSDTTDLIEKSSNDIQEEFHKKLFTSLQKLYGDDKKPDDKKPDDKKCDDKKEEEKKEQECIDTVSYQTLGEVLHTDSPSDKTSRKPYFTLEECYSSQGLTYIDEPLAFVNSLGEKEFSQKEQEIKQLDEDIKQQHEIEKDRTQLFDRLNQYDINKDHYDLLSDDLKREIILPRSKYSAATRFRLKQIVKEIEQAHPEIFRSCIDRFERLFSEYSYFMFAVDKKCQGFNSSSRDFSKIISKSHRNQFVILGSKGSGKTSLIQKFHNFSALDYFEPAQDPTRPVVYSKCAFSSPSCLAPRIDEWNMIETPSEYIQPLLEEGNWNAHIHTDEYNWIINKEITGIVVVAESNSDESLQFATTLIEHLVQHVDPTRIFLVLTKADNRPIYACLTGKTAPKAELNQDVLRQEKFDIFAGSRYITLVKDIVLNENISRSPSFTKACHVQSKLTSLVNNDNVHKNRQKALGIKK